jgi:hypothetical protein
MTMPCERCGKTVQWRDLTSGQAGWKCNCGCHK